MAKDLNLYWAKVNEKAIIPTKKEEDGGYDIYACTEDRDIIIEPGEVKLIPTGIASAFNSDYVCLFRERGSTGSKCMSLRMGVLDSGYRNEIFIGINNTSNHKIIITKDVEEWKNKREFFYFNPILYPMEKAIAQAVFVKLADFNESKEISYEELLNIKSERGLGKLGDSGK
jgi:dUTP pyrophosphatase